MIIVLDNLQCCLIQFTDYLITYYSSMPILNFQHQKHKNLLLLEQLFDVAFLKAFSHQ
jgi:hypothetical protein